MKYFTSMICWVFLGIIVGENTQAQTSDQERFIAKIISMTIDEDTGEKKIKETGAGILVDWNKTTRNLFIATAAHVVRGSDSILVILKESTSNFSYSARIVRISQQSDIDLALINVKIPKSQDVDFFKIQQVKFGAPSFGQELMIIGHPLGQDWVPNVLNSVTTPGFVKFNTSPVGIDKGYSGGGVFTRYSGHLAGMVYKVDGVKAYVLHIHELKNILRSWNILSGLIVEFRHEKAYLKYMIPGIALLGSSFILYDQFAKLDADRLAMEQQIYYPDVAVTGPNNSLSDFEDVQLYEEQVKKTQNKARQTLIVGSAGTILGLIGSYKLTGYLMRLSKEKKRLQINNRGYSRGHPFLVLPHGFSTGGTTVLGITIKF